MQEEQSGSYYVVRKAIRAVKYRQEGGSMFVTIPRGAEILVVGVSNQFGIVEVRYEDVTLVVFNRDIAEYADKMKDPGQGEESR